MLFIVHPTPLSPLQLPAADLTLPTSAACSAFSQITRFFFSLVAAQQSPAVVVAVWEAGERGRDAEEQGGRSVVRRGGQGRQAWWLPAVLPREHFQVVEMVAQSGINP